jgi:hypothetical protein
MRDRSILYAPMRYTFIKCTRLRCTTVRCTPVRCTPMRCTLMRCKPVRYMPMRCTPIRYTPMRRTLMRCTPVRYTPMRHPPTIALVALWPKGWSIYRDLSFKIRFFALIVGWSLTIARRTCRKRGCKMLQLSLQLSFQPNTNNLHNQWLQGWYLSVSIFGCLPS